MLITREVDYGLRILRALYDGEKYTVPQLCKQENIPTQFAYRIIKKLENNSFLSVKRGAYGGCQLNSLEGKNLFDVIEALDAVERINACMDPDYICTWGNGSRRSCQIHRKLQTVQQAVYDILKGQSLIELLGVPE